MTSEKFEQMIGVWNSDVTGDGMSLYFENGEVVSREDERDIPGSTMDYENGYLDQIEAKDWHMTYYVSGEGEKTLTDDGKFTYVEPGRHYEIEPIDYDAEIAKMDEMPNFVQLAPDSADAVDLSGSYENTHIYRGFSEFDGQEMACYVILLQDEFDHAYKLTTAETGSLTILKVDAGQISSTFVVDFDLDEWLENH